MKPIFFSLLPVLLLSSRLLVAQTTVYIPNGASGIGTSSSNVGIGTSSPTENLHIAGATATAARVRLTAGTDRQSTIIFDNDGSGFGVGHDLFNNGGHNFGFYDRENSAVRLFIDENGNVGMGTWAPGWQLTGYTNLDVRGSSYAGLVTVSTAASDGDGVQLGQFAFVDRNTTSGTPAVATIAGILSGSSANNRGSKLFFMTKPDNGALIAAMVIDRDQNVGIGTTSPLHKLAVNGTIRAKEVIVDTGWSDYVFADDYRLVPLSEVEAHIKAKKHLPGIPSADQVAEGGVSLGDMQSKLLAKVEELTLHVIRQEKQLRAQQEEIRILRAQQATQKGR